ncbi:MAG: GNAT family N-acetyltransferase, partial [Acidobacteria bacterium]|nr:GNAT family N-acetyltransferase [Acidobacteriota bacterium]
IIGVDPAYRRRGIAAKLIEEFTSSAEDHGIQKILTLVNKNRTEMEHFFSRLGFAQGQMTHFQKDLKS